VPGRLSEDATNNMNIPATTTQEALSFFAQIYKVRKILI